MAQAPHICTACGTVGIARRVTRGSFIIEVLLWFFFLLPGMIYTVWRLTTRYDACPQCKGDQMIPTSTPVGRKLLAERNAA